MSRPQPQQPPTDRVPPQNAEAEQAVLGSALLDQDAFTEAAGTLRAEDFYQDVHQLLWAALLKLREDGIRPDAVTLAERLRKDGQLDRIGGATYLSTLARAVPTSANVAQYARIVREMSVRRGLIAAGSWITGAAYAAGEDVLTLATEAEERVRAASGNIGAGRLRELGPAMAKRWDYLYETCDSTDLLGAMTGLRALDGCLGGLQPGDLIVGAGRPSKGKTSLALQIGVAIAAQGRAAAVFSLEMTVEQIIDRLVCAGARIDSRAVRSRSLSDEQWERASKEIARLGAWPIYIDDQARTTLEMRAQAGRVKGLGLIVIDYLGRMGDRQPEGMRHDLHVGQIVGRIKDMAQALRVPVLLLSQMSRKVEDRPGGEPQLSDLRDSGIIEQDADVVLFLWRKADDDQSLMRVKVAKNRNGDVGDLELIFDRTHTRFEDVPQEGKASLWFEKH
jgi:replicative DNA helicase